MNEGFGPNTTNEHTVQRWFKRFRNGKDRFEDEVHGNRLSALDNYKLNVLIEADSHTTFKELAKELCVTHAKIRKHLKEIGKTKINKFSHELQGKPINICYEVSSVLLKSNRSVPFLNLIIACDEKLIMCNNQ